MSKVLGFFGFYGDIRVVLEDDGNVLFVASDVAKFLGFKKSQQVTNVIRHFGIKKVTLYTKQGNREQNAFGYTAMMSLFYYFGGNTNNRIVYLKNFIVGYVLKEIKEMKKSISERDVADHFKEDVLKDVDPLEISPEYVSVNTIELVKAALANIGLSDIQKWNLIRRAAKSLGVDNNVFQIEEVAKEVALEVSEV